MQYSVVRVATKKQMDDFVKLPRFIYKGNKCYVPDMESDVRDMFNPEKNPGLEHAVLQPFVVYDEKRKCVGRVVAIINEIANKTWNKQCVRFGMIEFIDDEAVSSALIKAVEDWGAERGMTRTEGPLGITDFDKEGMLMSDFDKKGSMVTIYNPEYYPKHMERLGFEKAADWVQMRVDIPEEVPGRYQRVADLVKNMYNLQVVKLTKRQIYKEGYGKQVFDLFNRAYAPLFGFSNLSDKQQLQYINQYVPLIDLRMMPVILDKDNNVVGVAITIGSLTDALQKSKGRLAPLGWLHLLKALKVKHENKAEMILIAVDPKLQGMGVNALFFADLIPVFNKLGYTWAEVAPQLETNLKVLTQWKPLHPTIYKHRRCWGKEITK